MNPMSVCRSIMWLPDRLLEIALRPVTERLADLADTINAEIDRLIEEEERANT